MASGTSTVGWPSPAEGRASQMGVIRNPQQQGLSEPIVRASHYPLFPLLNTVVPIAYLHTRFDLKIRPETQWVELVGQEVFLFIH